MPSLEKEITLALPDTLRLAVLGVSADTPFESA